MDVRPASLNLALRMLWVLIAAGFVAVLLVVFRTDDLVRAWAEGNPAVREVLETRGLKAVKEGSVTPPHFVPVATTLYVVVAGLVAVLGVFLRNGFEWARVGITATLVFGIVASVGGFRVGQPGLFIAWACVCVVIFLALMVPLWHPATTAYIHAPIDEPEPNAI
ncbi:hypothetical protein [Nocardioides sp.]|uniref:hypothetical protein n=1 Tax=Nocardioides sp. TaxID=35761 RepID=UPI0039E224F4